MLAIVILLLTLCFAAHARRRRTMVDLSNMFQQTSRRVHLEGCQLLTFILAAFRRPYFNSQ